MSTINEIHRRVFDVLMEHHYREKEAGREFYFLTEISSSEPIGYHIDQNNPYKTGIAIRLCGRDSWQFLITLFITEEERVFICGYKNQQNDKIQALAESILEQVEVYNFKNINYNIQSYGFEINNTSSFENKIDSFLKSIWPILNNIVLLFIEENKKNVFQWRNITYQQNYIEDYSYLLFNQEEFQNYINQSPFYTPPSEIFKKDLALKDLEVYNFKGIKRILIKNLPKNTRWIFLTGENGFGKTSLLQAIAAGLYGRFDGNGNELIATESLISTVYYVINNEIVNNSNDARKDASQTRLVDYIATYGSSRLQISAKTTKEDLEKQSPPTYSLFNTDGVLLDVEQRLKDTKAYIPDEFNQIVNIFQTLMPNLAKIEIETSNKTVQVKYFEKDDEGNLVNEGVTFTQLAAGYRNIIAMIGDMIYRLSTKQDVAKLSDLEGIVIIDEIELHLHPNYQKLFVQKLTELFPKIQFIASTHSPIPLLGAPPETVILHVTRSREKGIEVEKLDIDFSVLTPNAILTSPIFGFQELIPESKPDDTMIRSEQTYQEVLLNDQLDKQIDEYLTEENKNELLSLLKK